MEIKITKNLRGKILKTCAEQSDTDVHNIKVNSLEFDEDGNVDIDFEVNGTKFERIRRITGKP